MSTPNYEVSQADKKFIGLHLLFATASLFVGILFGPLQALEHSGLDLYPYIKPIFQSYYQGLTIHGVLNALVWTTFFITGFLTLVVIFGLKRDLRYPKLNRVGFWVMVVGLVTTAVPILLDEATVLYTFYPPLKAHWAFYAGLTLIVVGSWIEGYGFFFTFAAWRKENPGVRSPLMALMAVITMAMWQIATLGIAVEILTMLLPWSLGLIEGTDPQLARTYFWFTGHPLVYFWLLPAYISWYAMLPKQVGGKLFSDALARTAFWLFFLLSTPLGFHHQFVDPGIPAGWKFLHAMLTYSVFIPSMLTAFTVIASLERAAKKTHGGKGLLSWIRVLPWGDPSVSAQLLAGILFFFGGVGGLTNASYNVNLVLHNTAWVPGHFHLTVASAATLSFWGISYWLIPYLTGKELKHKKLASWANWIWFVGMIIFSNAMHVVGLLGAPRRTPLGLAPYIPEEWNGHLLRVGIGGSIMFIGACFYFYVVARTAWAKKYEPANVEIPAAESVHDPQQTPEWLDKWVPWIIATVALIIIAYGPQLVDQIANISLNSPGGKFW
ncbi:MAG: b(o/a)3-type cytochrome-c oxidase subunit 1 [Anaerolineales bacterium]|nr:b(o/a)3-type cytochrome-c oxidase subunit 1 [Chloroflexota bacterium]MBL6982636.1 b(o/a)3-type cytochrome-c oxidase subunit 1 [Anaerolineales bacterium]